MPRPPAHDWAAGGAGAGEDRMSCRWCEARRQARHRAETKWRWTRHRTGGTGLPSRHALTRTAVFVVGYRLERDQLLINLVDAP
jgi:hypothetical protein